MKRFKHIMGFIFLFTCNGIMFWFFRGYLNLLIAAGMIVLLVCAFFSVHVLKRYVSVEIQVPAEYISKNTEFHIRIKLKNRCILPLIKCRVFLRMGNVFIDGGGQDNAVPENDGGWGGENIFTMPAVPRGTAEAMCPLTSVYAGCVRVRAEKLILEDLLGFHAVTLPTDVSGEIVIMPSGEETEEYRLNDFEAGMDEVEESRLSGSDFSDVSQIREYVPGDSMRDIHWKLTAKREELMVRERLRMSSRRLLVVFSIDRGDAAAVDEALETLFGFGRQFIRNRVPVKLFWWSVRGGEIREAAADSEEKWCGVIFRLICDGAGSGLVEEQFQTMYPEKSYIRIGSDGIRVR